MNEWWSALSGMERFFYYIAIPSTVIMILQFVLSILGLEGNTNADFDADMDFDPDIPEFDMDLDVDADADIDSLDFRFVSFRGIIAFLTMFGWVGITMASNYIHPLITLFVSTICGLAAMAFVATTFYFIGKLQSSGNINYKNSLGKEAEVYIPIPPKGDGNGKVQLLIQERLVEVEAISSNEQSFKTGEIVRIIDVFNNTTLVVEKE